MLKGELPYCFGDETKFDESKCRYENRCGHRGSCVGEIERRNEIRSKKKK